MIVSLNEHEAAVFIISFEDQLKQIYVTLMLYDIDVLF